MKHKCFFQDTASVLDALVEESTVNVQILHTQEQQLLLQLALPLLLLISTAAAAAMNH
jgi:hypothetical protein